MNVKDPRNAMLAQLKELTADDYDDVYTDYVECDPKTLTEGGLALRELLVSLGRDWKKK